MTYEVKEIVTKIGQIPFEGNTIPDGWYAHLKNDKGKIQTNAALILADIVYWHRPIPTYNIKTGERVDYGKKFQGDLLQMSYKYLKGKFSFTESQIRSALHFLEKKGLIFREYRDIIVERCALNNVMHIGVYPEKIQEITGQSQKASHCFSSEAITAPAIPSSSKVIAQTDASLSQPPPKAKTKDWTAKYTDEQKAFLDYLLNILPAKGDPIEKDHATWWIKRFGIEKIKTALQVYWQRVDLAKKDPTVPMPQHIGKYVRKALNDGTLPIQTAEIKADEVAQTELPPPSLENSDQGVQKIGLGDVKNQTTYTSMTSMTVNEINDKGESVTFQKEDISANTQEELKKYEKPSIQIPKLTPSIEKSATKKPFNKPAKTFDWKASFTSEENKFLTYLLHVKAEKGDPLEEKHVTFWIKKFGIEKIKTALQVYWQQIEKAKKNTKVPIPESIGAYVRTALNNGTQPCREIDRKNKAFAESFKQQMQWHGLKIMEKYCRFDEMSKEWHYHLPEVVFQDALRTAFENYCGYSEKQYFVA